MQSPPLKAMIDDHHRKQSRIAQDSEPQTPGILLNFCRRYIRIEEAKVFASRCNYYITIAASKLKPLS